MEARRGFGLHWAWIVLATCFVDLFINYSVRLGYAVVLPEMIRNLEFSRAGVGSIYNAYLISYLALTPLTGYLTDRLGARKVITACCLILGIGILLMGTIQSLWTACIFYAIVGVGATGMWAPILAVVQRWFAPARRGLALGIMSTGYGLGFATIGAVFPWIVNNFSWRHAWYFLGFAAIGMVFGNGLLLRSDPEKTGCLPWGQKEGPSGAAPAKAAPGKGSLSEVFRNARFWLIGLSYFSIAYSLYGVTTFMVDYGKNQLGFPLEKASSLASVHGIAQVVGVLTILPLSDYLGRKKTILLSNAFITCSLFGILSTSRSPDLLFVLVGVLAVFYGATFPMYGACAGDYFPRNVMGTVIGAWTPFYGIGAMLSHWVIGVLRDKTGVYDQAFLINAAMAAAGVLFMLFVKRPSAEGGAR